MKKKELKNLAEMIAENELIIQNSNDSEEVRKAQREIIELTGRVDDIEDLLKLDDLIQKILSKNLDKK